MVMPAASVFFIVGKFLYRWRATPTASTVKHGMVWRPVAGGGRPPRARRASQDAAARGSRLREFRWKNSAWLATAETMAGWNGFEMRKAGSGLSPVRKRSG